MSNRPDPPYPTLCRGDGYYLKRLRPEDVSDTYVGWLHDPEVIEYLQVRFEARDIDSIRAFVAGFDHKDGFIFGIHDAANDRHVGNITLRVNPHHLFANMGYLIGEKAYWEKGAALEAVRLILDFAFFERKIRKILECTTENHIASNFNFRRLGFAFEASIPDLYWSDGCYRAATYWSMNAANWADIRGRSIEEVVQ
jgi:RimJ/RimL family protein N-acetyltransferase